MRKVIVILAVALWAPLSVGAQSMNYHNGPVLVNGARVYFMWYGNWLESDKVPFRNFTLGAPTGYLGALSGYYDFTGTHVANAAVVVGEVNMGTPYGMLPTSTQMIVAMEKAINAQGWPCDPMAIYSFMPGGGTGVTGLGGASSHWSFPCGPEDGLGTATSVQVPGMYAAGNIVNYSHELVETITDPFGNWAGHQGWYEDSSDLEIADPGVCGTASNYTLSTGTFLAANYWRLSGGCTAGSGVTPPPPPPIKPCPPGQRPRGNSGKCK